jgi:hypothetical protein
MRAKWTNAELESLKRNYEKWGTRTESYDVPIERSRGALTAMAQKLGLSYQFKEYRTSRRQRAKLSNAIRMIASHVGMQPGQLVTELCLMRERGDL